jgi:hypothetical protein
VPLLLLLVARHAVARSSVAGHALLLCAAMQDDYCQLFASWHRRTAQCGQGELCPARGCWCADVAAVANFVMSDAITASI